MESQEPDQYNIGRFAAAGRNIRGNSRSRYEGRPDAAANKIQAFMRESLKLRRGNQLEAMNPKQPNYQQPNYRR